MIGLIKKYRRLRILKKGSLIKSPGGRINVGRSVFNITLFLTRRSLKHIAEKKKDYSEILVFLKKIIKKPDEIRKINKKRLLFVKESSRIFVAVVEKNIVVTMFETKPNYLLNFELLWRTEVPPSASVRTRLAGSRSEFSALKEAQNPKDIIFNLNISSSFFDVKGGILEGIHTALRNELRKLPEEMNMAAWGIIKKILSYDSKNQISLIPFFFNSFLKIKKVNKELLIPLGLANILGWTAYSVFDNFFDSKEKRQFLPIAIFCLRKTDIIYQNILPNHDFKKMVSRIIDNLDIANFWEITHCRSKENLPDYGDLKSLADRSLGHALGPIAILFKLGFNSDSLEVKNLISFFHHLLIARQLNDDLFDRDEDLKGNNISPVVSLILKKSEKEAIMEINNLIFFHLEKAGEKTRNLLHICEKDFFYCLIKPVLKAAEETRMTIRK